MKRLHHLSERQLREWQRVRQEEGSKKYGKAHLQRYGLVDVAEELLDALNIIDKMLDRIAEQGEKTTISKHQLAGVSRYYTRLIFTLKNAIKLCQRLDEFLPDKFCTDEQGGERIWWPPREEKED